MGGVIVRERRRCNVGMLKRAEHMEEVETRWKTRNDSGIFY